MSSFPSDDVIADKIFSTFLAEISVKVFFMSIILPVIESILSESSWIALSVMSLFVILLIKFFISTEVCSKISENTDLLSRFECSISSFNFAKCSSKILIFVWNSGSISPNFPSICALNKSWLVLSTLILSRTVEISVLISVISEIEFPSLILLSSAKDSIVLMLLSILSCRVKNLFSKTSGKCLTISESSWIFMLKESLVFMFSSEISDLKASRVLPSSLIFALIKVK